MESRCLLSIAPYPGIDELAPMPGHTVASAGVVGSGSPVNSEIHPAYLTQANGLPILDSRPDAPFSIYMQFDSSIHGFYNTDADSTTFSASEQADITLCWQKVATYFSNFNANVTTVWPTTQYFAWIVISPTISGGYSYCYINDQSSTDAASFDEQGDTTGRPSAIIHELGHDLGLAHQSTYDQAGHNIQDYSGRLDDYHGVMMGVDYDGVISKWIDGHNSFSNSQLQDDVAIIANNIKTHGDYNGDGFAPDDYTATTFAGATALTTVSSTIQAKTGVIERLSDQDYFSFTAAGGWMSVSATRSGLPFADLPSSETTLNGTLQGISPLDAKLDVYNSSYILVGESDDITDPDAVLNLSLPAGTYYAVVSSHGNYADLGSYLVMAQSLPVPNQPSFSLTYQNIGNASKGGSASYDSSTGTWTLKAGSGDIWDAADSLNYTYQQVTGDCTIVTRVTGMTDNDGWAKAGVMFRESLAPGSKEASMLMSPENGPIFAYRTATGSGTNGYYSSSTAFTPTWLKLVRSGNNFTAYKSSDGSTWTQWGSTQTISMPSTLYIGLALGAKADNINSNLNTTTFTNLSITGTLGPASTTLNGLAAPGGLTVALGTASGLNLSWSSVSGATNYAVDRSDDGVNYAQIAGGIVATSYIDANLTGSSRWWYRVRALNASAGTSPASSVVSMVNRPGAPLNIKVSSLPNSYTLDWSDVPVTGETGYRIERSTDGVAFTAIGSVATNVPSFTDTTCRGDTTYYYRVIANSTLGDGTASAVITRLPAAAGFRIASLAANQIVFQWSDVTAATGFRLFRSTLNRNGNNDWTTIDLPAHTTTYADTAVVPGGEYYYILMPLNGNTVGAASPMIFTGTPSVAPLPTPWVSQDIGAVQGTGTAGYDSGKFTLVSTGADIWDPADQFHYVYQTLNGNGSIVAQVISQENTGGWAKAGVMIRNSLSDTSQYAATEITPSNGANFQYRTSSGGYSSNVSGTSGVTAPYWVKLTRTGSTFSSYVSSDGTNWTLVGSANISMSATVYIGLAADSNVSNRLNQTTFANVTVTSSGNTAPVVVTPAAASAATITGASVNLSVLASDDYGEANLTYAWSVSSKPAGASDPIYSVNGYNAAKNTTATFRQAGVYTFTVTITDSFGLSVNGGSVSVTVVPTLTGIAITPATIVISAGKNATFTAVIADQFGNPFGVQPSSFTWSVTGGGSITQTGLYTAPTSPATVTVTAQSGSYTANSTVQVIYAPKGWWTFDAANGTTAVDSSGSGNTGTLSSSGTSWVPGRFGNAIDFSSSTAYVQVGSSLTLNPTTAITLAAWVNADTWTALPGGSNNGRIISKGGSYALLNEWGSLKFSLPGIAEITAALPSTGVWHYIAATYAKGDKMRLYVDGVLVAESSTTYSTSITTSSSPLLFGNGSTNAPPGGYDDHLEGKMDEVRIYNVALNSATLATLATLAYAAPSVAAPAAVSPSPVTGTTAALSVLAADTGYNESNLTYAWQVTSAPSGAATPTFTANNNNAAKNTTVTFYKAGTYTFKAVISDPMGASVVSVVTVTVNQTLAAIVVAPAAQSIDYNGTQTFTATAKDQFGDTLPQQTFTWNATLGSIDSNGLYSAPSSARGQGNVTASIGSITGTATVVVANSAPTVATAAVATPGTVTGATTNLSVTGADTDGESNLAYTWAATTIPSGATAPTFSVNGTNASKNSTAAFYKAGNYAFTVTITDGGGMSVTSTVNVTVSQTLTSITVSPSPVTLLANAQQTFTATARDQFGMALSTQPPVTWTASSGSITSAGVYTASGTGANATITAQRTTIKGYAVVNVNQLPTLDAISSPQIILTNAAVPDFINLTGISSGMGPAQALQVTATSSNTALLPNPAITYTPTSNIGLLQLLPVANTVGKSTVTVSVRDAGFDGLFNTPDDGVFTRTFTVYVINNTAPQATVTASSASDGSGHQPSNVTDGIIGIQDTGEWASNGQLNPWITLTWTTPRSLNGVVLYDRNNLTDWAPGGTLSFSDGSTVTVSGIPNAGTPAAIEFAPRTVTWVKFQVVGGSGSNVGLSEFQVMQTSAPTISTAAAASPSPVIGTTANLSVLAADDGGEPNLTYTWSATGPAPVTYSANGANAAKNATAAFTKAGTYSFIVTITDLTGLTTTSTVTVTVNQTLASIALSPSSISLLPGKTQQFTAVGKDQFGAAMSAQPAFAWSASAGSIDSATGLYTASLFSNSSATVTAAVGTVQGTASVAISDNPPTDILLSNASVNENQAGAEVGVLSTVDPDLGETYAYSIVGDPSGKFEIVGNVLKLKPDQSLDFETTPSVNLTLRTSDGTLTFDKAFTISSVDLPETLTVGSGDWTDAGLTLKLDSDGKLHVYRTGTTTDAVPPQNPANVAGIDITGRGLSDIVTVLSTGEGIPSLAINQTTLNLAHDYGISAGAKVTVNGGVLNFNGYADNIGNLALTANGQANLTALKNTTTTVTSGVLAASTIECDTLIIGAPSQPAAVTTTNANAIAPIATSKNEIEATIPPSSEVAKPVLGVSFPLVDATFVSPASGDSTAADTTPRSQTVSVHPVNAFMQAAPNTTSEPSVPAVKDLPRMVSPFSSILSPMTSTAEIAPPIRLSPQMQPPVVEAMKVGISLTETLSGVSCALVTGGTIVDMPAASPLSTSLPISQRASNSVFEEVSAFSRGTSTFRPFALPANPAARDIAFQSLMKEPAGNHANDRESSMALAENHFQFQDRIARGIAEYFADPRDEDLFE